MDAVYRGGMPTEADAVQAPITTKGNSRGKRTFLVLAVALVLLHIFFMLFRFGNVPAAPVVSDEVVINDPSVSLAHGHGYIAESFADSKYGLDKVFAHFPPVYPYTEALAFKLFGISAQSLRLTTTVMSIGSTVILLLLLYRLCVFGMMNWDVALLVQGLYCTNASYLALERTARMESMISLLIMVSLFGIVRALTLPAERRLPWLLVAGIFGAVTIAVHPEAVTAVLLLAALMLFLVSTSFAVRLGSAAVFVLVPLAVGLAIYRTNFITAVKQFLAIAHDSAAYNPTSYQWMMSALRDRDVSSVSRNLFLMTIMLLLAIPAVAYLWNRRRVDASSLQYRICACLGVVGVVEIVLMIFALRMDSHRCEFLFGVLLVCNALCLWGSGPLSGWQKAAGWCLVLLQCGTAGFYLYPRQNRLADANPDRFMSVVRRLPRGVSIAATPGLWLDMKEENRPFTLILNGLDGESAWGDKTQNPLSRFDVVVLENVYCNGKPWLKTEAQEGRTRYAYPVGSDTVEVYVRGGATVP